MKVAVLGATGLVGRTMLTLLESRSWVTEPPVALATDRSAGERLPFRDGAIECRVAGPHSFAGVDIALFSAGGTASRRFAPSAAAAGAWVVDNSSAFRMDEGVPLVVPEINDRRLPAGPGGGIIANPNCSTIQVVMALGPLHRVFGLREVHVTTMQAVSGAGVAAQRELADQLRACAGTLAVGESPTVAKGAIFPRPIAFNVIPEIGAPMPGGSFEEEAKVGRELRKILELPALRVSCLATRVPVWNGHAAAVRAIFSRPAAVEEAVEALAAMPGVSVADGPHGYVTPLEASGDEAVHVGRLRFCADRDDTLLMWVVADNVLKGAALNAVQIADRLAGREA